jgi:carbamoyl-phosphate synthase large subunit
VLDLNLIRPGLKAKVLIPSGAGSPGFGGIVACLREEKDLEIYAGDMQPRAYGKGLANGFFVMPSSNSPDYTQAVLAKCQELDCQVVLPITTRELPILSAAEPFLKENGIFIPISPVMSMEMANNKARLYEFMQSRKMPCVHFRIAQNKEELLHALPELGFPSNKLILKPVNGNGSRGFRVVCTETELKSTWFESKSGTVNTTEAALRAELPDTFPGPMIVSHYLPGEEYSVDLLADRGGVKVLTVRLREKVVSGISVRGTFVRDAEIEKQCAILVDNLDLHGPIGLQFKRDAKGVATILEINPRLQGAVSTARFVGVNFPVMAVKLAMGIEQKIPVPLSGVSFNRYWQDISE